MSSSDYLDSLLFVLPQGTMSMSLLLKLQWWNTFRKWLNGGQWQGQIKWSRHCVFLVACTWLYNSLCWPVSPSVTMFDLSLYYEFRALLLLPNCMQYFSHVSSLVFQMRPCISIRGSVRPSVGPSRGFCNEPITDENYRKWLGKQSKWSKLVKKSSELSQNVSKCPKIPTSEASLSERTCFINVLYVFCQIIVILLQFEDKNDNCIVGLELVSVF